MSRIIPFVMKVNPYGVLPAETNWIGDIPGGDSHSIDSVCYAVMDDVLLG